jgi:hypothetical protein
MRKIYGCLIFFLAIAGVVVLFTAASAQAYKACSGYELSNGTCTEMLKQDGTAYGYVVRLIEIVQSENETTFEYEVAKDGSPYAVSHANLEFIGCDGVFCDAVRAIVSKSSTNYEVFENGKGDPSTGFLEWFPVVVKIDNFPPGFYEGTFSITVSGFAYGSIGNLGFKAGTDVATGKILMPVCDKRCGVATSAASKSVTIATKDDYKFELICNESTGCCEVVRIVAPNGIPKLLYKDSIENFMSSKKPNEYFVVQELSVVGQPCAGIVGEDDSDDSPWYCSGGYCWY